MLNFAINGTAERLSVIVARLTSQHSIRRKIGINDHLVDAGFSSLAMVDLMLAVEAEFDVTIPQREIKPNNFQSIATLTKMLHHLGASAR